MIIQCPQCSSRYNSSSKNPGESIHCRCGTDFLVPALSKVARSWNCPNCGSVTDPKKNVCDYCDSYLAYSRCPSCFEIAPYDEAKYCAECGDSLVLPIKDPNKNKEAKNCPRCSSTLKSKIIDKHLVEACDDCGGLWLEHHLLEKIMTDQPFNINALLGNKPDKSKQPKRHPVSYLACPDCDTIMYRRNLLSNSNIIVDQCRDHGVWFDKNELAAALEFTASRKGAKQIEKQPEAHVQVETRSEVEVFEIKEEDLSMLLQEFPELIKKPE